MDRAEFFTQTHARPSSHAMRGAEARPGWSRRSTSWRLDSWAASALGATSHRCVSELYGVGECRKAKKGIRIDLVYSANDAVCAHASSPYDLILADFSHIEGSKLDKLNPSSE